MLGSRPELLLETTPPFLAREPSQTHRLQGNNDHVSFCSNAFRDVEFPLQAAIPKFGLKTLLGHEGGAWRGRSRGRGRGGFGGDVGGGVVAVVRRTRGSLRRCQL